MEEEKTLAQVHEEELKAKFTVLVKNRNALCNSNGLLRSENTKYANAYKKLLNEVGSLTTEVAADNTLRLFYMPHSSYEKCSKHICKTFEYVKPTLMQIIQKGSYEQLESALHKYFSMAFDEYITIMQPESDYAKSLKAKSQVIKGKV